MRIIHTSDWHLGQFLHDFDRAFEHARFLDWLLDTLVAEAADALLVAGDVFDGANPSSAAQALFFDFLGRARQRLPRLTIVVIAGNHDSPARLEAPSPVLASLGIHVVGQVTRTERMASAPVDASRLVVPLMGADGTVHAWCIAVPFLRMGDVPRTGEDGAADAFPAGVAAVYARALAHAETLRSPGQALVAMGHCHMAGGAVSELSERRILVGGAEALPSAVFAPTLAYTALGHLHLAQRVGGQPSIRYSGSPLPLSFAELHYPHQVLRVDFDGERLAQVTELRVPRFVQLLRVPDVPAAPDVAIAALLALELPARPLESQPYVLVRVELSEPAPDLRQRVEQAIAGKPLRLARIEVSQARKEGDDEAEPGASEVDLERLDPMAVFERVHKRAHGTQPSAALRSAFVEVVEQVTTEEGA